MPTNKNKEKGGKVKQTPTDTDTAHTMTDALQSEVNTIDITKLVANFRFAEFSPETEEWRYYKQRFILELQLQSLGDDKFDAHKRNLLLKCVGPSTYRLVSDHFDPASPLEQSFQDIMEFMDNHFRSTTNFLSERVKFSNIYRSDDQTVLQYIANLRAAAVNCKFGNNLEERLRDQFMTGIKNPRMQEKLFSDFPDVNAKLLDIIDAAKLYEGAQQQRTVLAQTQSTHFDSRNEVHKVTRQNKVRTKHDLVVNAYNRDKAVTSKTLKPSTTLIDAAKQCLYCGRDRHAKDAKCPAVNSTCSNCSKVGHWRQCCLSSGKVKLINFTTKHNKQRLASDKNPTNSAVYETPTIFSTGTDSNVSKATVNTTINGYHVVMEYDTAAHRTTINSTFWRHIGKPDLQPTVKLSAYTQKALKTVGEFTARVRVGHKTRDATIIVIDDPYATPLFGLDAMNIFNMLPKLENVNLSVQALQLNKTTVLDADNVIKQFPLLFSDEIGHVKNFQATIRVKEDAVPKIARARPVPYAMLQDVNDELDRMLTDGVIEAVDPVKEPIEWASPIVITERKNGRLRIVGDFKATVNPNIIFEPHPLPTFDEVFVKLSGSTIFSIVDLKDAFLQLEVDEKSRRFLTIATHRGYYRFSRLPLGLSVSPMIFQRFMDSILFDLEGVAWYQDDIAIGGKTLEEHLKFLHILLQRLESIGLRTQQGKVKLLKQEIEFLGFRIGAEGVKPIEDKVKAIRNMLPPENQTELRSFIGSVNQYGNFVPNLQSIIQPLNRLLKKGTQWKWTKQDDVVFEKLKSIITAETTLAHYSLDKPLVVMTDASERGLGAALLHREDDGTLRLISAASRTLNDAEKNYSAIDREAAAIIFAVGKFYLYLARRHFTLLCDHKPLERIFGEKSPLPKLAASRLVRWAIVLSAFNYTIQHIEGSKNQLADILSRRPIECCSLTRLESDLYDDVFEIKAVQDRTYENLALTQRIVKNKILADSVLAKIIGYIRRGWPEKRNLPSDVYFSYWEKRDELYLEDGLIMWHDRLIIPISLQQQILHKLHETHLGASAVKSLARSTVWWPGCDHAIETYARGCDTCRRFAPGEPETPLCLWNSPNIPWERIHIDYTGPYEGSFWFVVIDAFSRWMEIFPAPSANSAHAVKCLRALIARYGISRYVVSDNGTHFTSNEFRSFCKNNGMKLILTTPYHSRSNGRVERAIRTFKWRFSKSKDQFTDKDLRLQNMLFCYRTSVHTSTGKTPAELFLRRNVTTFLDTLRPSATTEDMRAFKNKNTADFNRKERSYDVGEQVYFKRKIDNQWTPAVINSRTGPLSYRANTEDQANIRLHADHLQRRKRDRRSPAYLKDYVKN